LYTLKGLCPFKNKAKDSKLFMRQGLISRIYRELKKVKLQKSKYSNQFRGKLAEQILFKRRSMHGQ
jgi:hypothetical protein